MTDTDLFIQFANTARRTLSYADLLPPTLVQDIRATLIAYATRQQHAIVQTPATAAQDALRAVADGPGERHD